MIKITKNSRIFTCGDLHGEMNISKLNTTFWPEQKELTENDFLIQAGDFGIIWKNPGVTTRQSMYGMTDPIQVADSGIPDKTERHWLNWFDAKPFYTLFIAGNHENHKRLNDYPVIDFYGGKASRISEKVFHLKNGYVYDFGGRKFFLFGGAESIDKAYRTEGVSWWPEEIPDYKTMQMGLDNLEAVGNKVDYIITHTMPKMVIQILKQARFGDDYTNKYNDPVSAYLDEVLRRMLYSYEHWWCGHFHEDKTLEHYKLTIMYNKVLEIINVENE